MDFTLKKYKELLVAIKASGTHVILRHDVDCRPRRALYMAMLEHDLGVKSIYFFRALPHGFNKDLILKVQQLGHEIGYHYESLSTCNGDVDAAYNDFIKNIELLSLITQTPITSICMHGSIWSTFDSKSIWEKYDYHKQGITFEPYLDIDFSTTFYLTDTGRCWDGNKVSIRDKIPVFQEQWLQQGLVYHTTDQVINALIDADSTLRRHYNSFLITTHPQRWMPFGFSWIKELVSQKLKNLIKSFIIRKYYS